MSNKIQRLEVPELEAVETSKAASIKATFEPMAAMIASFENQYNAVIADSKNEITATLIKTAKRLRLDIAKVRNSTEKARKEQKQEYLLAGKAIDGVSNILKWAIQEKEDKLKEIENHFEIQEKARLEALVVAQLNNMLNQEFQSEIFKIMVFYTAKSCVRFRVITNPIILN